MFILITLYLFLIGLCFGSFTLAMVDRMKAGKDWVRGRSECDYCKHKLRVIDLIPLMSWVQSRGKCRYCKKKLSVSYPAVELLTGVLFALSYVFWPLELNAGVNILQFIVWLASLVVMVGLFVFDVRWFLLPNKLIYPLIALGALFAGLDIIMIGLSVQVLVDYVLAILVGAGIFLGLLVVSSGKWIGDGDVRFGVAIGLFTGVWTEAWLTIFTASIVGILVAIPALISKKQVKNKMQLKVPFGPMLIVGLYITVLFGKDIISWYTNSVLLLP